MEDYAIDIMLGKDSSARSIRLDLPKFTLVGATTRAGLLTAPLRDRFGVIQRLEFYTPKELTTIILRSAKALGVEVDASGAAGDCQALQGNAPSCQPSFKEGQGFCPGKIRWADYQGGCRLCSGYSGCGQAGTGSER